MRQPLIFLFFALISFAFSILAFFEKGPLLNNAYIYLPKEEKKDFDKSPHYRQTAISLLLLGLYFVLVYLNISYGLAIFKYLSRIDLAALLIYAVWSAVVIGKKQRRF